MNLSRIGILFLLTLALAACNSISTSRIRPTEIPPFVTLTATPINTATSTPTVTATPLPTSTPTLVPTSTATPLPTNTPTRTPTPLFSPTPTLAPIPKGMGALLVINDFGQELNIDIASRLYKIAPNSRFTIPLAPGTYTFSASIPGVGASTGSVSIEANFYRVLE